MQVSRWKNECWVLGKAAPDIYKKLGFARS